MYRSSLTGTTFGLADSVTDNGVGFHALGGTEVTLAGVPQFSLSADIGYRWSQASFTGFEPSQIGFSLSGHWYLK